MTKKMQSYHRLFTLITIFTLLLNLFSPFFSVIVRAEGKAQESPSPTSEDVSVEESDEQEKPEESEEPKESEKPEESMNPEESEAPQPSKEPAESNQPNESESPESSEEPEASFEAQPSSAPTPASDANLEISDIEPSPTVEPSATPKESNVPQPSQEPEKENKEEDVWNVEDKKAETREPVELNVEYVFPLNDKVTVTFTKLPENPSTLRIEEIKLADNLKDKFGTEYAYDITTDMENGEFEFELTLPKEKDTKEDPEVIYAENQEGLEKESKTVEKEIDGEKRVTVEEDKVSVKKLNHMTVFVVVDGNPGNGNFDEEKFVIDSAGIFTVDNGDDGYSETSGTWKDSSSSCSSVAINQDGRYSEDADAVASWQFKVPEDGDYKIYAHWVKHKNQATEARYILDGFFKDQVDQSGINSVCEASGWYLLTDEVSSKSEFNLLEKELYTISLSQLEDTGNLYADAIKVVKEVEPAGCPMTGAIWTTNSDCTGVNLNIYSSKSEVYLNGGPQSQGNKKEISDGSYYAKVTTPNGDLLGKTLSPSVLVSGGKFAECYQLSSILSYEDNGNYVSGYKDTTNAGGEYKVWLSPDEDFSNNCSKTDNFKVKDNQGEFYCGDGIVSGEEECDYGELNGQSNCSNECIWIEECNLEEIANGGFETPIVSNPKKWNIFDNSEVPGWTAEWYSSQTSYSGHTRPDPQIEIHAGVNGWSSSDDQYVELDSDWGGPDDNYSGEPASISLSQTIPTIEGYEYKLSFEYSPRPNYSNNHLQVKLNSSELFNSGVVAGGASVDWQSKEYTFTADDSGAVTITFTELGTPDSFGMFLDDVSVECLGEIEEECEEGETWVKEVINNNQGTLKNGNPVTDSERTQPSYATGKADNKFYSLGYAGEIVLKFEYPVLDVEGVDLSFHETTLGRSSYPIEKALVEVSPDGIIWKQIGEVTNKDGGNGVGYLDFSSTGWSWVQYVKLTDTTNDSAHLGSADGYDLDAVDGVYGICEPMELFCGDGIVTGEEECDGEAGVTKGENFCTANCNLIPIYDGQHGCPDGYVRSDEPVGTYQISGTDQNGEILGLTAGGRYLFEVSGTYRPSSPSGWEADAGYSTKNNWTTVSTEHGFNGTGSNYAAHALLADFGSGVGVVDWGEFNSDHVYTKYYEPTVPNVKFVINDRYSNWFNTKWDNQSGMYDNEGELALNVYECRALTDVKVCKQNEQGQPLSGWEVILKEKTALETVEVLPDGGTYTSSNLTEDGYILSAYGTYEYRGNSGLLVDPGYSQRMESDGYEGPYFPWINTMDLGTPGALGIMVNGTATNWGGFTNTHQYSLAYPSYSGNFSFSVYDNYYPDNDGSMFVDIFKGWSGTTGEDGCYTFEDIPLGEYIAEEKNQAYWEPQNGISQNITVNEETEPVVFTNKYVEPVNLIAQKIVCTDETELPNWGNGGPNITESTAQDWVDEHESCDFVDGWYFEWAPKNSGNPGDTITGPAGNPWNTFGPTVNGVTSTTIEDLSVLNGRLETREVLQEGYLPFTYLPNGKKNTDNVSAEFYCNSDVQNYDNYEWLNNPEYGETYYCVGFNVPQTGSIIGNKWNDLDGDGEWGEEPGLSEWTINVYNSENELVDTTTTGDGGSYEFSGLTVGEYKVCEVNQEGWHNTEPGDGTYCKSVTVTDDEEQVVDFGNREIPVYDGEHSCPDGYTEEFVEGLVLSSESKIPTAYTFAANGKYLLRASGTYNYAHNEARVADPAYASNDSFASVSSEHGIWGTYRGVTSIIGNLGSGFGVIEWDDDKEIDEDHTYEKYLETTNELSASFIISDWYSTWYGTHCSNQGCVGDNTGNLNLDIYECSPMGTIQGRKYRDTNFNGDFDQEEKDEEGNPNRLNGWEIYLYQEGEEGYSLLQTVVTGDDASNYGDVLKGQYRFQVEPGNYLVCEEDRDGWVQTEPLEGMEFPLTEMENDTRCHTITVETGQEVDEVQFGNLEEVALGILKANDATSPLSFGDTVTFTITLIASGGPVFNVNTVDLPSDGFEFINGSVTATKNGVPYTLLGFKEYSSPGKYEVGDMQDGDEVKISFQMEVTDEVTPGKYRDLAWAYGDNNVLASSVVNDDGYINDENFVGTEVEVEDTSIPEDDVDVEEEEIEKESEGQVLGATAAQLPATGASTWILGAALLLILSGIAIFLKPVKKQIKKILSVIVFLTLLSLTNTNVLAGSLVLRVSQPETPTTKDFKVEYVALDLQDKTIDIECQLKKPGEATFAVNSTETLQAGGDNSTCEFSDSDLQAGGTYEVKVVANTNTDTKQETVSIEYDKEGPDTPQWINKEKKSDCEYEIEVKTADDGETSKIEIYRSDNKDVDVNESTRVKTADVGPDENYVFTHTLSGDDCGESYYAARAIDDSGNYSGARVEKIENIVTVAAETEAEEGTGGVETELVEVEQGEGFQPTPVQGGEGEVTLEEGEEATETGEVAGGEATSEEEGEVLGMQRTAIPWKYIVPGSFVLAVAIFVLIKRNAFKS